MRPLPVILLAALLVWSCKKKEPPEPPAAPPPPVPQQPADTVCQPIPDPPSGFIWQDSTADVNKNINAYFQNPLNGNEVFVVVNGPQTSSNQLLAVDLITKKTRFITNTDGYLPSINKQGWILFSNLDDHVYKIKVNGDSLTRLNALQGAHDPKWDHSGTHFYYLQDAVATIESRLNYANAEGQVLNGWAQDLAYTAPFHKSNRIIVQVKTADVVTLKIVNNDSLTSSTLFSGPYDTQNHVSHFRYLMVDENDENIYWSNHLGIFRHNLALGKTDTLLKNCETVMYDRPLPGGPNELMLSKHTISVLKPVHLFHEFKAAEVDARTGQVRIVNVF